MKTAVDSSVLLDVLSGDARFGATSREALRVAHGRGALVACEVVWAEVRGNYPTDDEFEEALGILGVRFDPLSAEAARMAGELWQRHRKAGGGGRERVIADFLIGAHARLGAGALLTRDRGFYRRYFAELTILDPSSA